MWVVTKVDGWIRKLMFLVRERLIASLAPRAGLRGTRHLIAFGDLSGEQLAAYDVGSCR